MQANLTVLVIYANIRRVQSMHGINAGDSGNGEAPSDVLEKLDWVNTGAPPL